jgi:hypothetical protein
MTAFVSVIGLQPAATVTVLATLANQKASSLRPSRVVLVATAQVVKEGILDRLEKALDKHWPPPEFVVLEARETSAQPAYMAHVTSAIANALGAGGGPHPSRWLVHIDPGPQHLVAAMVGLLKGDVSLLTTDMRRVVVVPATGQAQALRAADIGLETLLNLHDLPWRASGCVSQAWNDLSLPSPSHNQKLGLSFAIEAASGTTFDVAYERTGHLFLLAALPAGSLHQVRALAALRAHLHRLRPTIGVVSSDRAVLDQARAMGIHGLVWPSRRSPGAIRSLECWLRGEVRSPGGTAVLRSDRDDAVDDSPLQGAGGEGSPLVCWLGADPSATLVCLASHRPSRAWLLFDQTSAPVREAQRRLRAVATHLPCGSIRFLASDTLGSGVTRVLSEDAGFVRELASGRVSANLSPGRKVQGVSLARLTDARACTLDNRAGHVAWLDGRPEPCVRLDGPPILAQAIACGGPLLDEGRVGAFVKGLDTIARALDGVAHELGCESPWQLWQRQKTKSCTLASGTSVRVTAPRKPRRDWRLVVTAACRHGKSELSLGDDFGHGGWFEQLVAALFAAAGASEVRCNIKWAWLRPCEPDGHVEVVPLAQRTEVDVVARFGPRFVVASCKTGKLRDPATVRQPGEPLALDEAFREIEAVAAMGFGRFAIPVLAVPWFRGDLTRAWRPRQGVAPIDLSILKEPALTCKWVEMQASDRALGG